MATFTVRIPNVLTPEHAWRALWNLERHSEVIPLTRLHGSAMSAATLQPGAEFTARTAWGAVGLDDAMRVIRFDAPGVDGHGCAVIEKQGRMVQGHIVMTVEPAPTGSVVTWKQRIQIAGIPSGLDPMVGRIAAQAYRQVLDRLLLLDLESPPRTTV